MTVGGGRTPAAERHALPRARASRRRERAHAADGEEARARSSRRARPHRTAAGRNAEPARRRRAATTACARSRRSCGATSTGRPSRRTTYGGGKVYWGVPIADVLAAERIAPDVTFSGAKDAKLVWIHRRTPDADIWFVANQQERPRAASRRASASRGKAAELWDPATGRRDARVVRRRTRVAPRCRSRSTRTARRSSSSAAPRRRRSARSPPETRTTIATLSGPWSVSVPARPRRAGGGRALRRADVVDEVVRCGRAVLLRHRDVRVRRRGAGRRVPAGSSHRARPRRGEGDRRGARERPAGGRRAVEAAVSRRHHARAARAAPTASRCASPTSGRTG